MRRDRTDVLLKKQKIMLARGGLEALDSISYAVATAAVLTVGEQCSPFKGDRFFAVCLQLGLVDPPCHPEDLAAVFGLVDL